jgi:hypothetical protein
MRRVVLLLLLGGCDLVFELRDPPGDGSTQASDLRRRTITLTPPIQNPVENAPISILFNGDADLRDHMRGDAKDIRFQLGDEQLALEIVNFDQPNGVLDAWVRVPAISAPATSFDMLYGDGKIQPDTAATDVWPNTVVAAWHLQEPNDIARDSTISGIALRPAGGDPSTGAGIVGNGRRFAGDSAQLCAGAGADFDPSDGNFSISIWVNADRNVGAGDRPIDKGGVGTTRAGFNFELGTGAWVARVGDGDEVAQIVATDPPLLDQWVHLVMVVDRSAVSPRLVAYVNAMQAPSMITDSLSSLGPVSTSSATCLGDLTNPFSGTIDEARIYRSALTTDQVALEHGNLNKREQFMSIGEPVVD